MFFISLPSFRFCYQIIPLRSFPAISARFTFGSEVKHFVQGAGGITVCKEGSETRDQESLEIQQNQQGAGRFQM
jgi:hypothetical protein